MTHVEVQRPEMIKDKKNRLIKLAKRERDSDIASFFKYEEQRLKNFSINNKELYFDYSKNQISESTFQELISLGDESDFTNSVFQMFQGKEINTTENRKALHFLLRNHDNDSFKHVNDEKRLIGIQLREMRDLATEIRNKNKENSNERYFKNVIVIGIGGSHLGPELVSEALIDYHNDPFNMKFLVNADHAEFMEITKKVDAKRTLVIVVSKSMTTVETMLNLKFIKEWLLTQGVKKGEIGNHFITISNKKPRFNEIDIEPLRTLSFGEWVGGRYSLWSSVGLPIVLQMGFDNFKQLLNGAATVDKAFATNKVSANIPKILALLSFWNSYCLGKSSYAVIPYDTRLKLLPQYLQQLEMESNGKSVNIEGDTLQNHSAPLTWGGIGTSSQHAVFQFLHQSTYKIPVDFIMTLESPKNHSELHRNQIANCIAQSEALMLGNEGRVKRTHEPHKFLSGNISSNTIALKKLNPHTLGSLLAIYEHKTFFLSLLFSINAFDQWGVEEGKLLARKIESDIRTGKISPHDQSTEKLIAIFLESNKGNHD